MSQLLNLHRLWRWEVLRETAVWGDAREDASDVGKLCFTSCCTSALSSPFGIHLNAKKNHLSIEMLLKSVALSVRYSLALFCLIL